MTSMLREAAAPGSLPSRISREAHLCVAGSFALNPATGRRVPIWVADYVLGSYGSGAIMAVPAHDTRDHEFAQQYGLPVVQVVKGPEEEAEPQIPFTGEELLYKLPLSPARAHAL